MDIDQSVNGWFERISLIQRKADHYKLHQDILSLLSDKDGFDFYIKSKGIIISAHTCILRCRCPQFYHEVIKKVDVASLPIYLLERISDFIKCVYSENNVTVLEKKLIKSINVDHPKIKKLPSIDLYESKRISCDINPLYYSLAQYDDLSSSEFSDFEQCAYDDIESVILNKVNISNSSFNSMDIKSNNSIESHQVKSQSSCSCKESNVLANKDRFIDENSALNFKIDGSDIGNKVRIVNNLSNELQHDLIKKSNDDINSVSNLELANRCINTLDSSIHGLNNKSNQSIIGIVNSNTTASNPDLSMIDSKNLDNENILLNDKTNKMIQEADDDLDVILPNNFETFTVIKKSNESGDIFSKCSHFEDNIIKSNQDQLKNESINFQTFTVINENIIIDDDNEFQKDVVVNSESFDPETSNDYKTFTVVNGISRTPFHTEQLSSSSNSTLSNSKIYVNNNDIDSDVLPSTHTLSQFDTITLLPQSNNDNEEDNVSTTLNNDKKEIIVANFDIDTIKKENYGNNELCNQIDFEAEENIRNDVIRCSNNFGINVTSTESIVCTNIKQCSDVTPSTLCTVSDNSMFNFISEDNSSQNNSNNQHLEKLKSSGESDSTLSLHLDILENTKGMNSPDSLNEDEVFGLEEKPIVSNKLEFVPLEATPIKDNRSPRLSRKYMECSPVISANAYIPEIDVDKSSVTEENSERKNSSSFFIDFNQGKPKNKPKRFENLTKSLDSSTIANSKEKIFSMFIDFNEDSESSESSSKGIKHRKPQTLADRFVRMHSEEACAKTNDCENTVTPPPSRMTSTVENSSADISESCKKQSVFMFIENDSPTPVKRRSLPQSSRLKSQRNSWNVDSTVVHKTHHRTHSVNLSEESNFDARMTQSHIETGSKDFNKPSDSFDTLECNVKITVNGAKDSGIGLVDSFVRLSDMDKTPSQEIINSLYKSESKSESLRRDLKNTELGRCLKRMFPYLKSIEVERILLSKPPHALDNREEIKTGLGQDLLRMFIEEIGADTTIDVNGRRIKAHKCVLTSRCQYFAAMFSGGWVQSAGNVLYLKGFSYNTVHLTLRYIYSGECDFSEIKNVAELSKLADMLCLEGLKDNIMLYLAAEYCHFFKEVCERCTIGILECLTLSVAYGLDDLYLSCIVWINDNFSVVWPTHHFVSLPQDLKVKCFRHKVAHVDDLNDVLSVTEGCEKIKKSLPNDEWTKEIIDLTTDLSNSIIKYLAKHFYSTITSKYFKQMLESENLFADSFATHLLASCNCANRNQIRQAYDHLNKSSSNNFWHTQGDILVNAIMELIVKGLASDFRNGKERQAMGSLPNDYRMSEALAKRISFELGISGIELAANGTLITSSPVKKMTNSTRTLNKTQENKVKLKTAVENIPLTKVKTPGKFAEVKSRYMEPKPQLATPTPPKVLSVHKDLPRGRRNMSSSTSLISSPSVRSTMANSRLSTNRMDSGLKTKTSSELSLSTPKTKARTMLPKTDPLPSNNRASSIAIKQIPKTSRKPIQNIVSIKKTSNEKIMNGIKKQTIIPKTKMLPNGHPTIGSRSGTFCKDEPTVIHSKDITS
uniref:BTB/POZ domain-containing protein 8 n=1 Tax=Schizaphis graminum TaxID=13262 RepID=A0A2S2NM39_SCHGA